MRAVSADYLLRDGTVKIVLGTACRARRVRLILQGKEYADAFNAAEPYDLHAHVFYVPESDFAFGEAKLKFRLTKKGPDLTGRVRLPQKPFAGEEALLCEYDHGLVVQSEERIDVAPGLVYTQFACADREGLPVICTLLEADLEQVSLYVGTPEDGYAAKKVEATIPDMAAAAEQNGKTVLAAVNADFFDIFGDGHPSGLCVKNGKVIANADSTRPFLAQKKDGSAVITDLNESPEISGSLQHAAAGLEMIVKDGKIYDWGPLEPFAYVRHPRTAAGVTKDGKVLLLEVDGRIPAHSNGATLVDLANFLIARGADRALNLDGGGSSAVYIKDADGFTLKTVPADLFFPNDKLIRKDFNAFLIVEKN